MAQRNHPLQRSCKGFEEDLVLYYYGECGAAERSRIEKHLEDCGTCKQFLADFSRLLPLTIKPDEPPQPFWESYSKEMRTKLASVEQRSPWWGALVSLFRPWPVLALATALVLILALTFTFGRRMWRSQDLPPEEEGMMEILPMAENLEFFKAMELLDSLDLLEAAGGFGSGAA